MRFIDLFAGIGGFRLGLERANKARPEEAGVFNRGNSPDIGNSNRRASYTYHYVWSCDIDKYCEQVYRKNFGHEFDAHDIRAVDVVAIPNHDLLTAGFPCQSFSIAGRRGGFEDTRGTLFFEICRIAEAKRTPFLLLENVKGLLSHDGGKTFYKILSSLDELGYDCQWEVLNSKNFGVPQNRERVFIIGHLRGTPRPQVFPLGEADSVYPETNERITHAIDSNYHKGWLDNQQRTMIIHNMQPRSPDRPSLKYSSGGSGHLTRGDGQVWCLDSGNTNAVEEDSRLRRLTPLEYERLQGFPDGWTEGVSDTQRYKMLGNAVTVNVVEAIGRQWIEANNH